MRQIINGTVYGVGGYGIFWNEHHRKRMKAVVHLSVDIYTHTKRLCDSHTDGVGGIMSMGLDMRMDDGR
jgi:hypothetical protein